MPDDLVAKVQADYPSFMFLLNDPDVGPLLLEAVNPEHPLDPATFQAKLIQTDWWKKSSPTVRQWQVTLNTDPAAASSQLATWKAQLQQATQRAGLQFAPADLDWWANNYVPMGVAVTDPRIQAEIARVYASRPDLHVAGTGDIATIGTQLQGVAAQYFHPLAPADISWWQQRIASGYDTIQGFQTEMARQAAGRWSMYADQINAGITPDQLFSSQRNVIAQELEVDPATINLMSDPRWSKVLGVAGKDGASRPMTYNESIALARGQEAWKDTSRGKALSAQLVDSLTKTFGER